MPANYEASHEARRQNFAATFEIRFWNRVNKQGPVPEHWPELGPCWEWIGTRFKKGYGAVKRKGTQFQTHRICWEIMNGPIPEGQCVLHRCDNPPCCNPAHLFLGTKSDNTFDVVFKGRWNKRGTANGRSKLTEEQVKEIKHLFRSEPHRGQVKELTIRFKSSQAVISGIKNGIYWRHV